MNYLPLQNNIIIEAVFVGIYTLVLYCLLSIFIKKPILLFFVLGFTKHFIGDFVQLHTFYCNYGYACSYYFGKNNILHRISERKEVVILIESILEGILFILICLLVFFFFHRKWYWFFIIGFLIHLSFEKLGIHSLFCKYQCSAETIEAETEAETTEAETEAETETKEKIKDSMV